MSTPNRQPVAVQSSASPTQTVDNQTDLSSPITTTSPITNWQSYSNSKYGFSFKYPLDFSSIDCSDNVQLIPKDVAKSGINCGFLDSKYFSIFIVTLKEQPLPSKNGYLDLNEYTISKKAVIIANQTAMKYTFILKPESGAGAWDSWRETVDFTHKDYFYSVTLKDRTWSDNFDQILSTFKFTN